MNTQTQDVVIGSILLDSEGNLLQITGGYGVLSALLNDTKHSIIIDLDDLEMCTLLDNSKIHMPRWANR